MSNTYYVTTAIAYPNSKPHAGHMLEFIQADFLARYQRLMGKDVHFLTGTDEHGQKMVEAAKKEGITIQNLVARNSQIFKDFTKLLNMSNDDFIQTSDQTKHWPSVIKLWNKMHEKGDIYKKEYEGLYCVGCEKFILEKELDENGHCPNHKKKPELVKEENYFFKLSTYAKEVKERIEKNEIHVFPQTRKNEIISFLDGDVKDISFSRHKDSLTWGIPVPHDEDHVMYVWCDALTNYLSAVDYANESELYQKYWPASVHMIGKDILRFHAAYWPAMHLSAGVPPPQRIFAHGFLNNKGQKMSKSLGNVIDPYEEIEKYGIDPLRLYLLKELPAGEDGDYDEELVVQTINNELANDLGNLIRRVTVLITKHFDGHIPEPKKSEDVDKELIKQSEFAHDFHQAMSNFEFNKALEIVWGFVRTTNKYLTDTEPWKINNKERLGTVLYNALESSRIIAHYLHPAMPKTSLEILKQLGQDISNLQELSFSQDTQGTIQKGDIIFKKIESKQEEKKMEHNDQDSNIFPLTLKVAQITEISDHPNADKLYVFKLDLGTEKRQLVAGLKPFIPREELQDKKIVIVSNLKYAKLRGVESQGMLLAADDNGSVEPLSPDVELGTELTVDGLNNSSKEITYDVFMKLGLKVENGCASYQAKPLLANGNPITMSAPDGSQIR